MRLAPVLFTLVFTLTSFSAMANIAAFKADCENPKMTEEQKKVVDAILLQAETKDCAAAYEKLKTSKGFSIYTTEEPSVEKAELDDQYRDARSERGHALLYIDAKPEGKTPDFSILKHFPLVESLRFLTKQDEFKSLDLLTQLKTVFIGSPELSSLQNLSKALPANGSFTAILESPETADYDLSKFENITGLGITGAGAARTFTGLQHLKSLALEQAWTEIFTPKFIEEMAKAKKLEKLEITNTPFADGMLSKLFRVIPQLKALDLRDSPERLSLEGFAQLSSLEELDLSQNYKLRGLDELSQLTKLKKLRLQSCGLEDLPDLENLKRLDSLYLGWNVFKESIFDRLQGLLNLRILHLNNMNTITGKNLGSLRRLTNLVYLDLDETRFNDAGIAEFAQWNPKNKLASLQLFHTNVAGDGNWAQSFKNLPNLKELNIWATRVNDQGLKAVSESSPAVENLFIGAGKFTDEGATRLLKLKTLKNLNITDEDPVSEQLEKEFIARGVKVNKGFLQRH